MATAKTTGTRRRPLWLKIALVLVIALAVLGWLYREPLYGYAETGAAVGARNTCACRYVGGRALSECREDFEPGMGMIVLTEDAAAKSVTARFPLLSRETAIFRDGEGCTLERWRH
jgi:hypothetical protein